MTRAVIFDIDGTLANTEHRKHHLEQTPKNWPGWNDAMHQDGPRPVIVRLAQTLRKDYHIVLCTGRQEEHRTVTEHWLHWHDIPFDILYMRATGDYRDDTVVKSEMLDQMRSVGWLPFLVVEDRAKVVAMWRARGLDCLQCQDGDF